MAIAEGNLTSGSAAASSANTASVTLTKNRLALLAVIVNDNTGTDWPTITTPGNTGVWVSILAAPLDPAGFWRIQVYRAMNTSSDLTGTISLATTGQSASQIGWSLIEFSGTDLTGTNGSGAVRSATTSLVSGTNPKVTLPAFANAANATYGILGGDVSGNVVTAGTGFILAHDFNIGTVLRLTSQYQLGNNTADQWTQTNGATCGSVGCEIVAPAGGGNYDLAPFQAPGLFGPMGTGLVQQFIGDRDSTPVVDATPIILQTERAPGQIGPWGTGFQQQFIDQGRDTRVDTVGNATGTGQAYDASINLQANSGNAAGTGSAGGPTLSVSATIGSAAGTGAANTAAANVQPNAGVATGVGAAYNPTITAIEYQRPISDIAAGSWTVAPLWSKVDEVTADDTDFITSETLVAPGNTSNADLRLVARGDPLASTGQIISVRAKVTFTLGLNGGVRGELRQGNNVTSTLIGTLTTDALTTSYVTYTYTLSGAEADSITDYGDLFLRLYGNFPVGSLGGVTVSQVFFQQPAGITPVDSVYPDPGTGVGAANQPSVSVAPNTGSGAGTGAAGQPAVSLASSAGAATGTGTSGGPTSSVAASIGVATGTGTAYNAQPTSPDAHPGCATGIGQAYDATCTAITPSGVTPGSGNTGRRGPHGLSGDELRALEEEEILVLV